MFQRFIDRYQLWREERRAEREGTNPLVWFSRVTVLVLVFDAYFLLFTTYQLPWMVMFTALLSISFLILFARKSPVAWWLIPMWGMVALVQLAFAPAYSNSQLRVGLWLSLAIGVSIIIYGFVIRRRYLAYLERTRSGAGDANI